MMAWYFVQHKNQHKAVYKSIRSIRTVRAAAVNTTTIACFSAKFSAGCVRWLIGATHTLQVLLNRSYRFEYFLTWTRLEDWRICVLDRAIDAALRHGQVRTACWLRNSKKQMWRQTKNKVRTFDPSKHFVLSWTSKMLNHARHAANIRNLCWKQIVYCFSALFELKLAFYQKMRTMKFCLETNSNRATN